MFMPFLAHKNSSAAASISPLRVPIGTPARGVKPMDVSMHLPPSTAEMEEPLPRWQVTILSSSGFLPRYSAAACETNLCDVPCAP